MSWKSEIEKKDETRKTFKEERKGNRQQYRLNKAKKLLKASEEGGKISYDLLKLARVCKANGFREEIIEANDQYCVIANDLTNEYWAKARKGRETEEAKDVQRRIQENREDYDCKCVEILKRIIEAGKEAFDC